VESKRVAASWTSGEERSAAEERVEDFGDIMVSGGGGDGGGDVVSLWK